MLELGCRTLVKFLEAMNDGGSGAGIRCKPVLLQIRSIVPVCGNNNNILPDQGFFLKVADLSHALYVSLRREDDDLVLSNKLQLGQFVYVDKLEPAYPVPKIRGITPLPGRRRVDGNPKDLLSTVGIEMFLDDQSLNALVENSVGACRDTKPEDGSVSSIPLRASSMKLSSCRSSKAMNGAQVESYNSEMERYGMSKSRSLSSSGCKLSDAVRRSQNFQGMKTAMGTTIDIRSSKTQQKSDSSDVGGDSDGESMISSCSTQSTIKRKSWCIRKRCGVAPDTSHSPERKLSEDDKSTVISKMSEISVSKKSSVPLSKLSSSRKNSVVSNNIEGHSNKSVSTSYVLARKNYKDAGISWEVLPARLMKHGQDVSTKRDLAFLAAINYLQEAASYQRLLKCLSSFSKLLSMKHDDQHDAVEDFFNLQDDLAESRVMAESLSTDHEPRTPRSTHSSGGEPTSERRRNAEWWINFALECDLTPVPQTSMSNINHETPAYIDQSIASETFIGRHTGLSLELPMEENVLSGWVKAGALPAYAELANSLENESSSWFFNHVEVYLNWVSNEMNPEQTDDNLVKMMHKIKRISDWLDKRCKETSMDDLEIQSCGILRKKIYKILLKHVEMTTIRGHN